MSSHDIDPRELLPFLEALHREAAESLSGQGSEQAKAVLSRIDTMMEWTQQGRLASFLYPTLPRIRYGWDRKPAWSWMESRLEHGRDVIAEHLLMAPLFLDFFAGIQRDRPESDDGKPYWRNMYLPVIDAVSLCTMLGRYRPARFVEIGSGNSTRFARAFVDWADLPTRITSIDRFPGITVRSMPHEMISQSLQEADLTLFHHLQAGDVVWLDGSHHVFSDTDVSVFFMELLPLFPVGTIVGIHDIQLPWDYPPGWERFYFNETFALASFLVGAKDRVEYLLPCFYANVIRKDLRAMLDPIWQLPALQEPMGELDGGGAFWFRVRESFLP